VLDIGTGGGEYLSKLNGLPRETYATEVGSENAELSRKKLELVGVTVIHVDSEQVLPFETEFFDLVINRHASIDSSEVFRVLKPNGRFITQQVGGLHNTELSKLLGSKVPYPYLSHTLERCRGDLKRVGFRIQRTMEDFPETVFFDVGAVVFYLKVITWQVPDFSVKKYRERLKELHRRIESEGKLSVRGHSFFIEAGKEG